MSEKTASKSLSFSFDGEDVKGAPLKEKPNKPKEDDEDDEDEDTTEFDITSVLSSSSTNALIVQLVPLLILHPLKNLLSFFVVMYVWLIYMHFVFGQGHRFVSLLLALSTAPLFGAVVYPFVGIIAKWLIIGRYKPGKYPLFGTM